MHAFLLPKYLIDGVLWKQFSGYVESTGTTVPGFIATHGSGIDHQAQFIFYGPRVSTSVVFSQIMWTGFNYC